MSLLLVSCSTDDGEANYWDIKVYNTLEGTVIDLSGATITFSDVKYSGSIDGELLIHSSSDEQIPTNRWLVGLGNTETLFEAAFNEQTQTCNIKFGDHSVSVSDRGTKILINEQSFDLDPGNKSVFTISEKDGVTQTKGN